MENEKLKYIQAKQRIAQSKGVPSKPQEVCLKISYKDFGLAYGMEIDYSFDDLPFLAKRIEEYRANEKVKAILLEKDIVKIWLKRIQ